MALCEESSFMQRHIPVHGDFTPWHSSHQYSEPRGWGGCATMSVFGLQMTIQDTLRDSRSQGPDKKINRPSVLMSDNHTGGHGRKKSCVSGATIAVEIRVRTTRLRTSMTSVAFCTHAAPRYIRECCITLPKTADAVWLLLQGRGIGLVPCAMNR
jgi:hypothetical protein